MEVNVFTALSFELPSTQEIVKSESCRLGVLLIMRSNREKLFNFCHTSFKLQRFEHHKQNSILLLLLLERRQKSERANKTTSICIDRYKSLELSKNVIFSF